jgi:hypothetical protein
MRNTCPRRKNAFMNIQQALKLGALTSRASGDLACRPAFEKVEILVGVLQLVGPVIVTP